MEGKKSVPDFIERLSRFQPGASYPKNVYMFRHSGVGTRQDGHLGRRHHIYAEQKKFHDEY